MKALALTPLLVFASISAAGAGTLVVRVEGVQGNEGQVRVGVCDKVFDISSCPYGATRAARAGTMEFRFNVPAGGYGIAAYHDLNANGQLDRSGLGIPREPWGFSNDVGRMSRPTIPGALVKVGQGGAAATVRVRGFGG